MTVTNEPGYYSPNEYGIRIENQVLVRRLDRKEGQSVEDEMMGFEC